MNKRRAPICQRLAELRELHYGVRGKSQFAKELGIGPSTYDRYERDRVPPAELLVKVAKVTRTRIEWLLTGEGIRDDVAVAPSGRAADLAAKLQTLLSRRPELSEHVESLLSLLAAESPRVPRGPAEGDIDDLIPVVGSTAAGLARFWAELDQSTWGPQADARLESVLVEYRERSVSSSGTISPAGTGAPTAVALVQCSRPDELGFLEFLSGTGVRKEQPHAVAWRIDGDSMFPRYADGDFVITSSDHPAVSGHACVARQKGQIGVNCKLFQQLDDEIALIPVNEKYAAQRFPADQFVWAYRVLYSVRLG